MKDMLKRAVAGGIDKLEVDIINGEFVGQVIYALKREPYSERNYKSHLYMGTFGDVGKAFCNKAPSSIWRNNLGTGICKQCLKKLHKQHIASLELLIKSQN